MLANGGGARERGREGVRAAATLDFNWSWCCVCVCVSTETSNLGAEAHPLSFLPPAMFSRASGVLVMVVIIIS